MDIVDRLPRHFVPRAMTEKWTLHVKKAGLLRRTPRAVYDDKRRIVRRLQGNILLCKNASFIFRKI